MAKDKTVMLLGQDIGVDGGVFRVTEGLQAKFGADRVVDTPLAEAGIIGCSIGLAINGMKPVAEMQFCGFGFQGIHQIKQHVARLRKRSYGVYSLPLVIRMPVSGGIKPLEHHSESPENFYVHCQGLKVVMPSSPYNAKGLLISAIRDPDPVIFLEPKKIYRSFKEEVPEEEYTIPIGEAEIVKEGKEITIVTWGAMTKLCKETAEQMPDIDMEIIDLRTIWPLDEEKIIASVKKTGRAIVVEEAPRAGSFGSEVIARIQEHCLFSLNAPIGLVSGFSLPFPQMALEDYQLPNVKRVSREIKRIMEF